MAQRYIYLSDELNRKLKGEENASALISRLLNQHYENMQPVDLTAKMEEVEEMQKEISLADSQLADHGVNNPKIFAYPYGIDTSSAEQYLQSLGYSLSFTTNYGSILCKGQRLSLPRIRIGNAPLSAYGL